MIIQSKRVWLNEQLVPAALQIADGKIVKHLPYGKQKADQDFGINYILPGFLDIHTHGHCGVAAKDADVQDMRRWQKQIREEGVTSFLPTVETQREQDNIVTFRALSALTGTGSDAEILGIHMEGNFISKRYKGAHNENLIVKPDLSVMKRYLEAAGQNMKLMILAIEEDEDYQVLDYAVQHGVVVSAGHSGATYAQMRSAMAHGVTSITHTYNAMAPFHHREPGLIGAAFDLDELYCEIIADGHHVSWPCVRLLGKMKDKNHLILVSDASPMKQYDGTLPDGIIKDEEGQFRTLNGNLCSSSLRICDGIYNLITHGDVPFVNAVNAATINPAKLLGIDDRKGSLQIGRDADIAVTDEKFQVIATYCKGNA